ncbi:uncharacterized protein LOC141665464 [Apium graveolens]|uniref:uncharacterized protein LOC141665464 n=1 Tax=Apium graveolens TaxID=4045 RepID=UPI003D79E4F3
MQLNAGNTKLENKIIAEFNKWQLAVGDGKETNISPNSDSGEMLIKIPDQYIAHKYGEPIQKLFEVTYPDFLHNISSHEYLRSRAILAPTNIVVDEINTQLLVKIPGTLFTYLNQDSINDVGDDDNDFRSTFLVEYLNSINMPCIPKHELKLKGQSLDIVGLYLPRVAFSHEHTYVAISRVTRPEGLHILIDSDDCSSKNITKNIVFEEVFYNLPSVDN